MSIQKDNKYGSRGIGAGGEETACEFLRERDYIILARNYHSRFGEIDIIAQKDTYIVFVEVKARKAGSLVSGIEAVSVQKQRKIVQTAMLYLADEKSGLQPRFDVIEVKLTGGHAVVNHIKNAFDAGGFYGF